jgi:uncharacterized protein YdaU (DUF1376 family)
VRAWFPFYAADWLADEDVELMTLEQQGAYVRLLCYQWREGSIPADPNKIRNLLGGINGNKFRVIWSGIEAKFPLCNDASRRENTRLRLAFDSAKSAYEARSVGVSKYRKSLNTGSGQPEVNLEFNSPNQNQNQNQNQNKDLSLARVPAALTPHVLGLMFDQETGRPNSGNLTALSSLVDRIRKHRELSKAERTEVEHAAAFVAGFKSIVGQWKAAGKPAPSLTVEKFDEHFAHVCDWVEGKFRVASTSTQQPAAPRRRNDLTALATGKVRES